MVKFAQKIIENNSIILQICHLSVAVFSVASFCSSLSRLHPHSVSVSSHQSSLCSSITGSVSVTAFCISCLSLLFYCLCPKCNLIIHIHHLTGLIHLCFHLWPWCRIHTPMQTSSWRLQSSWPRLGSVTQRRSTRRPTS